MEESHSLAAQVWTLLKHRTEMAQRFFLVRNYKWSYVVEHRETAECQDVKRCLCAQNSLGFLLYQLDISKLFLLPADPVPCHKHCWRLGSLICSTSTSILLSVVGCRHLIYPPQSLLKYSYDILRVLSVILTTSNWGLLILFGKDPFWLFSEPFGLSTTLGCIQGFALLSFWEWDLQRQSCTSFHAQNSKALSVEK